MRNGTLIEQLEPRDLFSSITTIGQTGGVTPAAARNAGTLQLGPNVVNFNAVRSSNTSGSSSGPNSATYELRVYNTSSTSRLLIEPWKIKIEGADADLFSIDASTYDNSTGISMASGRQINITLKFTANDTPGVKTADIRFATSDPRHPIVKWPLRGLVTRGEGTTFEPSLQQVFDFFQLPINAGQVNNGNTYFTPSGTSDEVDVQTLQKADPSKPVILRPLAEFTNHATPAVRMGFYTPGVLDSEKYLWYSPSESSQSLTPLVYGQSSFDPGSGAFGLVTQYPKFQNPDGTITNVYSEDALNKKMYAPSTSSSVVHMKFYPYKDQNGTVVPNAYIVAEEEYNVDSQSDSQDLVFVVTNVKPAADKPTVAIQNLTGYPSNSIASFNVVQNDDAFVPNITRSSNTFRVFNSGTQPLVASFGISGDYVISSGGGSNVTIAPGAFRDVKVSFTATSGTAVHAGQLVVTSNDTTTPTATVALLGNWQLYSEQAGPGQPSLEPSALKLVNDLLAYQTILQNSGQTLAGTSGVGSAVAYVGQEIPAEYFQTADTDGLVTVTQLATFHNQTYTDTNGDQQPTTSFISWYKQGSPTGIPSSQKFFTDLPGQGQTILGNKSDGTVAHGKASISGSQVFGFVVEHQNDTDKVGEYSDHTLNPAPNPGGLFLRFFPAYDAQGVRIPNTYIMLHDYNRSTTNFDFQDNIYLITNIMPAGAMKTPRTVYVQQRSDGNLINFTSPDDGPKVYGFNVYRQDTPTGAYTLLNGTPLARRPSGSFVDSTAVAGHTYYYSVTTVGNGGVESDPYTVKVN